MKTRSLIFVTFVLAISSLNLANAQDKTPCMPVNLEETTIKTSGGVIVLRPLTLGSGLLVAEPGGLVRLFNGKGEVEKQADLKDSISSGPFEMGNKVYIIGNQKIHILKPHNLDKISSVDLPGAPNSTSEAGDNMFGVGFRSGGVAIYDGKGEKKFESEGIYPTDKFSPFFSAGKEVIVVGSNGIKFLKGNTDLSFTDQFTAGAGNGNHFAVGNSKGQLHIIDVPKKKFKTLELSGVVDKIISVKGGDGFLISTKSGKFYHLKSGDSKAATEFNVRIVPGGLSKNEASGIVYAASETGEVYQVQDGNLQKTKLKGNYENIYSWSKGFVTYHAGLLQVLDASGNVLNEKTIIDPGRFGINQIQNTFFSFGNPIRAHTVAKNAKCKDQK